MRVSFGILTDWTGVIQLGAFIELIDTVECTISQKVAWHAPRRIIKFADRLQQDVCEYLRLHCRKHPMTPNHLAIRTTANMPGSKRSNELQGRCGDCTYPPVLCFPNTDPMQKHEILAWQVRGCRKRITQHEPDEGESNNNQEMSKNNEAGRWNRAGSEEWWVGQNQVRTLNGIQLHSASKIIVNAMKDRRSQWTYS